MTDDDLDRQLTEWFAGQNIETPSSLRGPAHLLGDHQPRVVRRGASRSLPSLAFGAVLIAVCALVLRGMFSGFPLAAPASSATMPIGTVRPSPSEPPSAIAPRDDWTSVTWAREDSPAFQGPGNQFIVSIAPIGSGFVAAGYETGAKPTAIVWIHDASAGWVRAPDPGGTFHDSIIDRLAVVPDGLIAIGRPGSPDNAPGTRLWKSIDGRSWTRLTVDPFVFGDWYAPDVEIVSGPGGLIAFGAERETGATRVWHSQDGTTWTGDPDAAAAFAGATVSITPASFGYVATGARSLGPATDKGLGPDHVAAAFRSADGINWEPAVVDGAHALGQALVARDGLLTAGSTNGPTNAVGRPEYWHSTDGRTWQPISESAAAAGQFGARMIADGDRMYALSRNVSEWSIDGSTWRPLVQFVVDASRGQPWEMYQVASGPGGFLATGETNGGSSGAPDDETDGFLWRAAPGRSSTAVPMPTPVPENDTPCPSKDQNADGSCG